MYSDTEKNFLELFFKDQLMKEDFKSYSEVIFLDELRLPVYIFLVEDSMGKSKLVGVGLLVLENAESLKWLLERLKKK